MEPKPNLVKNYLSLLAIACLAFLSPLRGQWSNNAEINTPVCTSAYATSVLAATSDGAGGAIFVWVRSERSSNAKSIRAQRIDSTGARKWASAGVVVASRNDLDLRNPVIVADGAGGAIVAWTHLGIPGGSADRSSDVLVQRLGATGEILWAAVGVPVSTRYSNQSEVGIAEDGSGGVVLVWRDAQVGASSSELYAQRIDGSGQYLWSPQGVEIQYGLQYKYAPSITGDGTGGAVVAALDKSDYTSQVPSVFACKLDAAGSQQGTATCAGAGPRSMPKIASDGSGGVIVCWMDQRNGQAVYAQRVDASMAVQWQADGIQVGEAVSAWQGDGVIAMEHDGAGGAIMAWEDDRNGSRDVFAQRVDQAGTAIWGGGGRAICAAANDQVQPVICPDGQAGAIFCWTDERKGRQEIFAQRVDAAGLDQWGMDGIVVCDAAGNHWGPAIVPGPDGGAIVAWMDSRNGTQESDIYAQGLFPDGRLGGPEVGGPFWVKVYPNPWMERFTIETNRVADRVVVTNLLGQRVAEMQPEDLIQHLELGSLRSGVYCVSVYEGEERTTVKLVKLE